MAIGFLLGVPAKLKTLTDRLTSARATKLDNLDATVSGRASQTTVNTINTNTTNVPARLDTTVSSRAAQASADTLLTRLTSARAANLDTVLTSVVKSIQTGWTNATTLTSTGEDRRYVSITISAVTVAKSIVLIQQARAFGTGGFLDDSITGRLLSSTSLIIACPSAAADKIYCRWTVIEFN